jgi:hypothetical protein
MNKQLENHYNSIHNYKVVLTLLMDYKIFSFKKKKDLIN